jgi:hypothetical protein
MYQYSLFVCLFVCLLQEKELQIWQKSGVGLILCQKLRWEFNEVKLGKKYGMWKEWVWLSWLKHKFIKSVVPSGTIECHYSSIEISLTWVPGWQTTKTVSASASTTMAQHTVCVIPGTSILLDDRFFCPVIDRVIIWQVFSFNGGGERTTKDN